MSLVVDMADAVQGPMTETGSIAFEAMTLWAEQLNLPLRFKRDLYVHDRRALMSLGSAASYGYRYCGTARNCFAWGVSERGTTLIWCDSDANLADCDDSLGGALWHWFDGRILDRGSVAYVARKHSNWREHAHYLRRERAIAGVIER
jgi:hypothetical protein